MKFSTPSMLYMNNFIFKDKYINNTMHHVGMSDSILMLRQSTCKLVTDNYISLVLAKRLDYTMLYS